MWVTIISDGVSIATQSLLSRYLAQNTEQGNRMSHLVIRRSFQIGLALSSILAFVLYFCRGHVISLLTKQPDIHAAALQAFPVFLVAQGKIALSISVWWWQSIFSKFSMFFSWHIAVAKGFAFPVNGIIMGGMDWGVAMWSMIFANLACFVSLALVEHSSRGLWMAWSAYYLAQAFSGLLRYKSKTGIWKRMKSVKGNPSKDN